MSEAHGDNSASQPTVALETTHLASSSTTTRLQITPAAPTVALTPPAPPNTTCPACQLNPARFPIRPKVCPNCGVAIPWSATQETKLLDDPDLDLPDKLEYRFDIRDRRRVTNWIRGCWGEDCEGFENRLTRLAKKQ